MARTTTLALPMTKRRFTAFFCVFLLLFAQQAALTHAAWHAQLEHESHPAQQHDDASLQGELCALHGAFTQVLGGVHSDAARVEAPIAVVNAIAGPTDRGISITLRAPRSRGPPRFS
jgi:hypothetical protein